MNASTSRPRIRACMARTGERYVTARRHVLGVRTPGPQPADDHGWRLRGGVHPETATITSVLANLGGPDRAGRRARLHLRRGRADRHIRWQPAHAVRRVPRRGRGAAGPAGARGPGRSFRAVAGQWHELAETALPLAEPALARIRELLAAVHESVVAAGDAGAGAAATAARRLWATRTDLHAVGPFDAATTTGLFAALSRQVEAIFEAETAAVAELGRLAVT
jgi:hypothetical protein